MKWILLIYSERIWESGGSVEMSIHERLEGDLVAFLDLFFGKRINRSNCSVDLESDFSQKSRLSNVVVWSVSAPYFFFDRFMSFVTKFIH